MARQNDTELRGPDRLAPPRVSVVRLNRRVLYVAGGVLLVAVIAGLVALRDQAYLDTVVARYLDVLAS